MQVNKKHIKLAEILSAFFTGSQTDKDKIELEKWIEENKRNKEISERILDRNNFIENNNKLLKFPTTEAWNSIESKITSDNSFRIKPWQGLIKYAAVLVLLISVAGGLYIWNQSNQKQELEIIQLIPSGSYGAILTLNTGEEFKITTDKNIVLQDIDGTNIMIDTTGNAIIEADIELENEVIHSFETLTGMEYSLTLADGTSVFLNAESKIDFPVKFIGDKRVVELEGEAYFKVAKNENKPFVIKTGEVLIEVLGTSFNVRSYKSENEIVTTLVEGKVAVSEGTQQVHVVAGEQAIFNHKTKQLEVSEANVAINIAWQSGKFVFRNERMEDIMNYLARWYGIESRYIDEQVKDLRIGTSLDRYNDMNPIIEILRKTNLVNVTQVDKTLYISSK